MLNIKQIELKFTFGILDAGTVRILNLGPASEARWDGVSKAEERNFLFEHFGELRALRAWAYQTHVPNKDVEQLGDFVQAVSPQPTAGRWLPHPRAWNEISGFQTGGCLDPLGFGEKERGHANRGEWPGR